MDYEIEVKCCVCGRYIGKKKGGKEPNMISHGYCDNCLADLEVKNASIFQR